MRFERTLIVAVPPEALWPLISDTDRLNRETGLPEVAYQFSPDPAGGSKMKAASSKLGMRVEWDELPFDWSAPYFHSVERRFRSGPMRRFVGGFELEPRGESSTHVKIWAEIEPAGLLSRFIARRFANQGIDRMVEACRGFAAYLLKKTPWSHGRRLNARVDEAAVRRGRERLAEAGVEAAMIDRLVAHLREAPEEEVVGIRPYRMADRWGFDRRRALEMFLEASQAGLVELRWTVVCPACRGAKFETNHLHAVKREASCESCAVSFSNEFDRTVEARFDAHPGVRAARKIRFCAGGPGNTPHRSVQLRVSPGERREVRARLEAGTYTLSSPQSRAHAELTVEEGGEDGVAVELTPDAVVASAARLKPGDVSIAVSGAEEALLRIDRAEWDRDAVSAAEISTFQKFRDLYAEEAIEAGQEMSVGRLAFLFSDLEGSTALYEQVGDVPAFALVKRHFEFMKERIARHRGAIVKTMGDAVMAVFADAGDALAAAAEVQRDAVAGLRQAGGAPVKFRVKLGVHAGPCVVVGTNGIVDYFGTTVNLAQRVQSAAAAGDVVACASTFDEARARAALDGGWDVRRETLSLRGFDRPIEVVRFRPA